MRLLNLLAFTGFAMGLFIATQGAWAQTSFLNIDVPVEQQSPEQKPPEQKPAKVFPKCANSQYTANADLVEEMVEQMLGFKSPFSKKLVDKTGQNRFILFAANGSLQVKATVEGSTYDLAGSACQADDGLIVKLVHPMATKYIKVRGVTENKVRITRYENGREDDDSSSVFTGYSTRSVR